jgi:hypothetical protein
MRLRAPASRIYGFPNKSSTFPTSCSPAFWYIDCLNVCREYKASRSFPYGRAGVRILLARSCYVCTPQALITFLHNASLGSTPLPSRERSG